jgi:hypothetical protein
MKNVNTEFRIELDSPGPVELKLISVTPRVNEPHEQAGMERFSAVFSGRLDLFLPQQTYRMVHPEMGEFEVFLVPIAQDADGFRYEAVYNVFRGD